jgi:hypothetical protein
MAATVASEHAHLMTTGLGPFYDGLTQLFLTPEDLPPVIALALFAGLRGPRYGRAVLFVLPAAGVVGSFAGGLMPAPLTLPAATATVTIASGALVAADQPNLSRCSQTQCYSEPRGQRRPAHNSFPAHSPLTRCK